MSYTAHETDACVTLEPSHTATASVIWLHGLGADGYDFVPIVNELRLPPSVAVRFIFPHARVRPVTINNGYEMRAWYDIKALTRDAGEDDAGIRESAGVIRDHVAGEAARGIAARRIVIAGFSQGGAVALQTGLRHPHRLAGVMALSTYLPLAESFASEATQENRGTPLFMAHGTQDGVVPYAMGARSRDLLIEQGYDVEWHEYPMQHSVCLEEIEHIGAWLTKVLA